MQMRFRLFLKKAGQLAIALGLIVAFIFIAIRVSGPPITVAGLLHLFGAHPHAELFAAPVLPLILARLPSSLVLIAASFAIASAGVLLTARLSVNAPNPLRKIATSVLLFAQSIPYVWFVLTYAVLLALLYRGNAPFGVSGKDGFDLGDRTVHLLYPALCLALFQLPHLLDARSVAGLWYGFTKALPETFGAVVITETVFAWPGNGRLFFSALTAHGGFVAVALLFTAAFTVAALRSTASDA